MTLQLRKAPKNFALTELLSLAGELAITVGFIVADPSNREVDEGLVFLRSSGARFSEQLEYPGARLLSPATVVESRLDSVTIAVVSELFDGSLYGPEESPRVQDMFMVNRDGEPWLWSTSSECLGIMNLDRRDWEQLVSETNALRLIPINDSGIIMFDEESAQEFVMELEDLSPRQQSAVLAELLEGGEARTFPDCVRIVVAATLVREAVDPGMYGDFGWSVLGSVAPSRASARALTLPATLSIERVQRASAWRSHWQELGLIGGADREIDWLRERPASR